MFTEMKSGRCYVHSDYVLSAATCSYTDANHFGEVVTRKCPSACRAVSISNELELWGCLNTNILHVAGIYGNIPVLKWVLEQTNDDINDVTYPEMATPLHEAICHGHIDAAVLLLKHGASLNITDCYRLKPLDYIHMAFHETIEGGPCDLYTWGINSNYNLGHGGGRSRQKLELVLELWKRRKTVTELAISKFHTIILTEDNEVYTCGHGFGGKLGHGNEDTILYPKRVEELRGIRCTKIAAAHDHSLVLDAFGKVYSFGNNSSYQLGILPPPRQCHIPTEINCKILKGNHVIGIAAGRFHSAIYTYKALYTFGRNGGHLGYRADSEYQIAPKLVSFPGHSMNGILTVAVTDAVTLCAMRNGDIFLLKNFVARKIASKLPPLKSLSCAGGHLEEKFESKGEKETEKLQISVLLDCGEVKYWSEHTKVFETVEYHEALKYPGRAIDIVQGKDLMIVSSCGHVYQCTIKPPKDATLKSTTTESGSTKSTRDTKTQLQLLIEELEYKKAKQLNCDLKRISYLTNTLRIFSDSESRNFGALKRNFLSLHPCPTVTQSCFETELLCLLDTADIADGISDILLKGKKYTIPAHQFILSSRLQDLNTKEYEINSPDSTKVMVVDFLTVTEARSWLRDVYTGRCKDKTPNSCRIEDKTQVVEDGNDFDQDNDVADILEFLNVRDLDVPTMEGAVFQLDERSVVTGERMKSSGKRIEKKKLKQGILKTKTLNSCTPTETSQWFPDWKKMEHLSDMEVESSDGMVFKCHKCILVARSEYFQTLNSGRWAGANNCTPVMLPIPGKLLKIVLTYIYTDEVNCLQDCDDIKYLCEVLAVANQFLLERLKEIAEGSLAKLVTLKNVVDLLEFSCIHNADKLKRFCCTYLCHDLETFLTLRLLDSVSPEALKELNIIYRELGESDHLSRNKDLDFFCPGKVLKTKIQREYHLVIDNAERYWRGNYLSSCMFHVSKFHGNTYTTVTKSKSEAVRTAEHETRDTNKKHMVEKSISKPETPEVSPCKRLEFSTIAVKESKDTTSTKNPKGGESNLLSRNMDSDILWPDKVEAASQGIAQSEQTNCDFKAIMAEEECLRADHDNLTLGKNSLRSLPLTKATTSKKRSSPKKTSQKQRKKKIAELKKNLKSGNQANNTSDKEEESQLPVCPWAQNDPLSAPTPSLKDVMTEEMEAEAVQVEAKMRTKELSKSTSTKRKSTGTWEPVMDPHSSHDFVSIMEFQKEEKDKLSRRSRKPLPLIQIEEKAVEEILAYYNSKYNTETEYITVTRLLP